MKTTIAAKYHKHICNGGVSIELRINEELDQFGDTEYAYGSVEFDTMYFGYPAVKAVFNDSGMLSPDDYRNIGAKFIEFAAKLDAVRQKADT